MNGVNTFPTIGNFSDANHYSAAGAFAASAGAAFSAYIVGMITPTGAEQFLMGNYDAADETGWRLFVSSGGVISADIGDGSAIVTLTGTGAPLNGFVCIQLTVDAGAAAPVSLYVNNVRYDTDTLAGTYEPTAGGDFALGYDTNAGANPANGCSFCSLGFTLSAQGTGAGRGSVIYQGARLAASPGGALLPNPLGILSTLVPDLTAYRCIFDNDGAHPPAATFNALDAATYPAAKATWAPYIGTTPNLTRTGTGLYVLSVGMPWA